MLGSLLLAAAVPEAFSQQAPLFAGAYVAINTGRSVFLVLVLRGRAEVSGCDLGITPARMPFARVCGDGSRSRALNLIVRAVAAAAQPCRR
jgi:hypothetical protein